MQGALRAVESVDSQKGLFPLIHTTVSAWQVQLSVESAFHVPALVYAHVAYHTLSVFARGGYSIPSP